MTARILVVDDVLANLKLLEARLSAEYFDVITAMSGPQALSIAEQAQCDIVLLDVMMPGMDGFEVCRRLKANPATHHIPVIMVTALDEPADRVRGLEAGADDFLTKPVNDLALVTRVRSLVRLKMVQDELRMRALTSRGIGMRDPLAEATAETGLGGRILVVDDRASSSERIVQALRQRHEAEVEPRAQEALFKVAEGSFDLVLVSMSLGDFDPLRLCSQIRSLDRTRGLPILLIAEPEDEARLMRGLDIGVNDYLLRPVDRNEMAARVATQIRRKRYTERLRDSVQQSMALAVTDGLTGLYNRRYMESHLGTLVQQAAASDKPLSLLVLDIDYFKAVNDTWGHEAGDEVLREFAQRVRKSVRGIDLVCRLGGEEFVVVMPDTDAGVASIVAERIRAKVAGEPFPIRKGAQAIEVTVSIGMAQRQSGDDEGAILVARADQALYRAKRDGRNRVVLDAA